MHILKQLVTKKKPYFTLATVVWFLLLAYGTLSPVQKLPEVSFKVNDKFIHLLIFLVLILFTLIAYKRENFLRVMIGNKTFLLISLVLIIAICTEGLQQFIPGRSMDIFDLIANTIGVILGFGLFQLLAAKTKWIQKS